MTDRERETLRLASEYYDACCAHRIAFMALCVKTPLGDRATLHDACSVAANHVADRRRTLLDHIANPCETGSA